MSLLSKVIGITALGLSGYDTVRSANRLSDISSKNMQLERLNDAFVRTSALNSNSQLAHKMQQWTRNWYMSDNWLFKMMDNVSAFTSNFIDKFGDNITSFGLAATAILCGKSKLSPIKLPIIGKIAAGLLAAQGVVYVVRNLFGFGTESNSTNSLSL